VDILGRPLGRAAAALVLLAAAGLARAQEGVRVESIDFEGNRRYSTENLRYSMRTKAGKPLDRELLNRDIAMLRAFFETLSLKEEPVPGGVRLLFQVVENPLVAQVLFVGNREYAEADLRAVVETRSGYPLASYRLENDVRLLERKYREAGFHWVEVRGEVLDEEGAKKVLFRIVEGPGVEVDEVRFEGMRQVPLRRALDALALRPSRFLSPRTFVERRLEEDRVALARAVRDQGFLESRVWLRGVAFGAGRDEAVITWAVEEGEPWTLGEVQVTGGGTIPDRGLVVEGSQDLVPGQRWLQADVDRAVRRMEEEARRQGFADARVEVEPLPRPQGRVQDLRLVVAEGRRITVRFVEVSGNALTRDKVVLREFTVAPGEPLDQGAVAKSVRRTLDTQYFTSVVSLTRDTDSPDRRDLEIKVEENPRTSQFRVGFGLSSDTGLFGNLSLTFRNFDVADPPERLSDFAEGRAFKGAGQTLALVAQPGSEISSYRVAFTEPWFLDRPISLGFDVYATKSSLFTYHEGRTGASVAAVRRWLLPGRDLDDLVTAGLRPRIESVDIGSIQPDAAPNAFALDGRSGIRALALDLGWSRVDQETAERGWRLSGTTELLGGPLGGDFDTWKNSAEAIRVFTLFRDADERAHTLRFRAAAATAWGFDGTTTPLVERWFAGGQSGVGALRGFRYGGVGPHGEGDPRKDPAGVARSIADNSGQPMGGEALLGGGAEYGFPLFADVLRGAVFLDAGNLGNNTSDLRRDWRASAGLGLGIRVPYFGPVPLRFDFGFPLRTVGGDEKQVLSFEFSRFF